MTLCLLNLNVALLYRIFQGSYTEFTVCHILNIIFSWESWTALTVSLLSCITCTSPWGGMPDWLGWINFVKMCTVLSVCVDCAIEEHSKPRILQWKNAGNFEEVCWKQKIFPQRMPCVLSFSCLQHRNVSDCWPKLISVCVDVSSAVDVHLRSIRPC